MEEVVLQRSVSVEARMRDGERTLEVRIGGRPVPVDERELDALFRVIRDDRLVHGDARLLHALGVVPDRPPSLTSAQLAPGLGLGLELAPIPDVMSPDQPLVRPTDLEYALFLMPFQVRHLEGLREQVLHWVATVGVGRTMDDLVPVLGEWLEATYARDTELRAAFDLVGEGGERRLVPLHPIDNPDPSFPPAALIVEPPGRPPLRVPLDGWPVLNEWGAWLSAACFDALSDGVPTVLLNNGCLVQAPDKRMQLADGEVLDVGGGCFVVMIGEEACWVDPWLPSAATGLGELPRPDAIVLTTARQRSFPLTMLLRFPRDVPVVLPGSASDGLPNRMAALLKQLGYTRVIEVGPGDSHEMWSGGIDVEAAPAGLQYVFRSGSGTQRLCPGPPAMDVEPADRVFCDLRNASTPALEREPGRILAPVRDWLELPPQFDWEAFSRQAAGRSDDVQILYDSAARWGARGFQIDEAPALRRLGAYAHWDERPGRVRVSLTQAGQRHR